MKSKSSIKDSKFKLLFSLAAPIALQNLLIMLLSTIDIFMISRLGKSCVAAVSLANQPGFIHMILQFGVGSGAAVFTSQYWGKKDFKNIKKVAAMALLTGLVFSMVFWLVCFIAPAFVLSIYTNDNNVIKIGSDYLRIVSLTFFTTAIVMCYASVLRSTSKVIPALFCSVIAIVLNTCLNYCLIFGNFGFPCLGVKGAAIATLISRILEAILILIFVYKDFSFNNYFRPDIRIKDFMALKISCLKEFYKKTVPVILNELGWGSGTSVYFMIFARVSTTAVAAYTIADQIMNLSMVIFFGTCQACAVIIGNAVGAGKYDDAKEYANTFIRTGLYIGIAIGALLYSTSDYIFPLLCKEKQVLVKCIGIINIFCLVLPLKGINFHTIVGSFRGGGDTFFAMILEVVGLWCIGIPLAIWAAFYIKVDIITIYCLVCFEEAFKTIMSIWRIKAGNWIHDLTINSNN